jgi:hypothetical protein
MSLYRFFRTSALLALAGKYRARLYRIAIAIAVALVTAWLYGDIKDYLQSQQPDLLGRALLIKTVIVYGSLFYAFWQVRPGAWSTENTGASPATSPASPPAEMPTEGPLDELLDKPRLKSRKEAILSGNDHQETD